MSFEEDLQEWLARMDDALEEFFAILPARVRDRLDYSIDSLDVLEAWLLERYPDSRAATRPSEASIVDGAERYVGETFCKLLGGHWWVDPAGEIMCGQRLIKNHRTGYGGDCPRSNVTACTTPDRRYGTYSSGILRMQLDKLSGKRERMDGLLPMIRRFKMKTHEEVDFEYWLTLMDRGQKELLAELPAEVRERLDHSIESLDVLEAWLLARYPDGDAIRAETEIIRMDGVARYIGETFRRHAGGRWWLDIDGWTYDGLPQLDLGRGIEPVCPLALAREAAERRGQDLLATTLRDRMARRAAG